MAIDSTGFFKLVFGDSKPGQSPSLPENEAEGMNLYWVQSFPDVDAGSLVPPEEHSGHIMLSEFQHPWIGPIPSLTPFDAARRFLIFYSRVAQRLDELFELSPAALELFRAAGFEHNGHASSMTLYVVGQDPDSMEDWSSCTAHKFEATFTHKQGGSPIESALKPSDN